MDKSPIDKSLRKEGEVLGANILMLVVRLWRGAFTGAVRFENIKIIKIIYFKDGNIIAATSNDLPDNLGEILVRQKKLTKEHVKQALLQMPDGSTLGESMVTLGFITRKELLWSLRLQVVEIVGGLMGWSAGTYNIVDGVLPKRSDPAAFFSPHIVMDCIFRMQDRAAVMARLGNDEAVFELMPGFIKEYKKLDLNEEADVIIAKIDGKRTLAAIAAMSKMDTFDTFKLVCGLYSLEMLRPVVEAEYVAATLVDETLPPEPTLVLPLEQMGMPDFTAEDSSAPVAIGFEGPAETAPAALEWEMETPALAPSNTMDIPSPARAGRSAESSVRLEDLDPDIPPGIPVPAEVKPTLILPGMLPTKPVALQAPSSPLFPIPPEPTFDMADSSKEEFEEAEEIDGTVVAQQAPAAIRARRAEKKKGPTVQASGDATGGGKRVGTSAGSRKASGPGFPGTKTPELHFSASKRHQGFERYKMVALIVVAVVALGGIGTAYYLNRARSKAPAANANRPIAPLGTPPAASPSPAPSLSAKSGISLVEEVTAPSGAPANATPLDDLATPQPSSPPPTAAPPKPSPSPIPPRPSPSPAPRPTPSASPRTTSPLPSPALIADSGAAAYRDRALTFKAKYGAQPKSNFTLQLELVCQTESLQKAETNDPSGGQVWFAPTTHRGRSCFKVYWGSFSSRAAAEAAVVDLPAAFTAQGSRPQIVTLRDALR